MTVFVGSRHEGYGEAGMAHLLEHMLFKGTPDHPDIPKVLTARGAQFNGTTWVDRTNYFETLPAGEDNLEFALRLEADRLVNSHVRGEDLKSEMSVVRNEFERGENDPERILEQRMTAAAYEWHNYGKSTIGNRADIERVPIENLRQFYRKYYQPDNAMVVVAGSFDPEQALEYIGKYFGSVPRPERELDNTYTEEPAQDGERFVTLRRVGEVAVVGVLYHIPAGSHPEYPSIDVLEGILTAAPSGRLYKSLVESKKAASVSGAAFAWHDPGVLRILAEVAQGNDPDVILSTMNDTIEQLVEEGVTQEEVDRIKQRLLKFRELSAADSSRIAIELSEWAAMGDWRLYFLYRDYLEKVTPESVNEVARKYLKRSNRTVGMFLPTKEPHRTTVPQTPELAELIGDYQGREGLAAGEAFDVSPESIEERTRRVDLPGGVKAALIPKKTRGESVNLRLTLRYGDAKSLQGLAKATELLPQLMTRGTEKYTRQQLADELDRLRAQLSASGSAGEATFSIQTKRESLPEVLKLLQQVLREPTLPESELEIIKRAQLASLEQGLVDPQTLATVSVRRHITPWPKGDPRYIPTVEEEIDALKAVDRAEMQRLYGEYLGAPAGELAVVGDFDPDEILPIVKEMLAGWEPEHKYERLVQKVDPSVEGGFKEILTPDKENAVYFAAMAIPVADDHKDYPALVLGNFILGGGSLSSRLGDRVRQQEGLSYGVGSGFNASSLDPRAAFYVYAISNPDNMSKVRTAIREELNRILEEGVTEQELSQARSGYLQEQAVTRTNDGSLARILASDLQAGRTMEYWAELEEKIKAVTADDVVEALRKHIDPDELYVVAAGDFEKATARRPAAGAAAAK
jgi:zinc protease